MKTRSFISLEIAEFDEDLVRAYQLLKKIPGAFPQAVSNAVNRTLETVRSEAVRGTAGRYFVKQGEVRKTIDLKKTSAGNLHGAMISRGKRKRLQEYKLTPNSPAGNKKGFKGAVMREGGLKPLPKGTFMMNTPTAGWLLFNRIRPGKGWGNIEHIGSPSIPQIIKNRETFAEMQLRADRVFWQRLDHEVMRILGALP